MGPRVIGVGQPIAGDDGVGIVVLDRLRETPLPPKTELYQIAEATTLIPLLETPEPVIVIDALVGGKKPGMIVELEPERFMPAGLAPLSTHGIGVIEAIELARTLSPTGVTPWIRIVGVTIEAPILSCPRLSPAIADAVPGAVAAVLALLGTQGSTQPGSRKTLGRKT